MITPLQKQALFALRQALALCDEAGISISGSEVGAYAFVEKTENACSVLTKEDIEDFEHELSQ